jgi:hypothetical protein
MHGKIAISQATVQEVKSQPVFAVNVSAGDLGDRSVDDLPPSSEEAHRV